jgi:dUTP pyrophosphatase
MLASATPASLNSDMQMSGSVKTDMLLVKKLSDSATIPTRGSIHSAGYDLYAAKDIVIPAKGKAVVPTVCVNLMLIYYR